MDLVALIIICITIVLIIAMLADVAKQRGTKEDYLSGRIVRALDKNTKAIERLEQNLYLQIGEEEDDE